MGDAAKHLSESPNVATVTIFDIFDCSLYNTNNTAQDIGQQNPLRCIMDDPGQKQAYFENMSRAYADLCSRFVTVMTPDVTNIPTNGIWNDVVFPELKRTAHFDGLDGEVDFVSR